MNLTQTTKVLDHMLCESMGLYYAADKEKAPVAKRRQLVAEPYGWISGSRDECWPVVSTFHFLRDRLEYDQNATKDLYQLYYYDSGSTLGEIVERWGQIRELGEAVCSHTLSDAHSLDHDFRWFVFDEGEVGDQIAVVQTCDELGLSSSTPFAFRVNQLEDFFAFRRAIVHCLSLGFEQRQGVHVWEFTGDQWEEYLVTNDGWEPNPHGDDPFTNVLPLGKEEGEEVELPDDPGGVIYYNHHWDVYHCPRCTHELDVEGPGL
jgi:hypothetical protein